MKQGSLSTLWVFRLRLQSPLSPHPAPIREIGGENCPGPAPQLCAPLRLRASAL